MTTIRTYLEIDNGPELIADLAASGLDLDVDTDSTRIRSSNRTDVASMHADAPADACRSAIRGYNRAKSDCGACKPARVPFYEAKKAEAFAKMVSALRAVGVPTKG